MTSVGDEITEQQIPTLSRNGTEAVAVAVVDGNDNRNKQQRCKDNMVEEILEKLFQLRSSSGVFLNQHGDLTIGDTHNREHKASDTAPPRDEREMNAWNSVANTV
ncbi:hypothetical protein E2C01_046299 [Portunus trituberculatus]|uniref:Uncharacterized protein n=1 Tax=Portunus trituberculatus TaxID=210409 RepID=A0A5B7FXH7_PORTR|nr:hypothetical protein [Portunus trituberculatus]